MKKTKTKRRGMRRVLHILMITVLSILGTIAAGMAGIFIFNQVSLHNEASQIKDYGKKIEVFDGTMNVVDEGQGEKTIILLTGYATGSPGLDYQPLMKELKDDYRVVVIEPFGYGLSSQTERERTAENMTEEIHTVVEKLGLDSYILMGHSIAGIYILNYANTYPEDVEAFIGIDTSVPNQPWESMDVFSIKFLQKSGMMRVLANIDPEVTEILKFDGIDDETFKQQRMLNLKNLGNRTVENEAKVLDKTVPESKKLSFPKDLPVLLFVADSSEEGMPGWLELHEEQAATVSKGEVVELSGSHYLHHNQSKAIAEDLKDFLNEN